MTCANYGIYVATCVICHQQYAVAYNWRFDQVWKLSWRGTTGHRRGPTSQYSEKKKLEK